jgi:putative thioredoxin
MMPMTQQPFTRRGAIDLSALKRPASPPPTAGGAPTGGVTGAYALDVDEQNFQALLEKSMAAPVVLVFFSPTRMPESTQLADDVTTVGSEFDGRFLVGRVDIDRVPAIAQAMQIPSIPLVVMVLDGRPMPLLQDVVPLDELRTAFNQVMQQLTTQGVTQRHQPLTRAATDEEGEQVAEPRYAAAQDALGEGDADKAVAEYQKLVDANPADAEATAGLAMAKLLQRTQGVDLNVARAAAADNPDDVDAQVLVADLDLLGGHVDDAFNRLIGLVARTSGDERNAARQHLIGLFAAVGNDDARVIKGRRNLASALF